MSKKKAKSYSPKPAPPVGAGGELHQPAQGDHPLRS